MKKQPAWLRLTSILAALLLMFAIALTGSTPQASAYNCADRSNPGGECYAVDYWARNVDGVSANISINRLYGYNNQATTNQVWLKDTLSAGCTSYPNCWFEAGYAYAPFNEYTFYYYAAWVDPANGLPVVRPYANVPDADVGRDLNLFVKIYSVTPTSFVVFLRSPSGQWQSNPGMPGQLPPENPDNKPLNPMHPNYIFVGQRLSGYGGAYALEAKFSDNQYYSGGNWYPQTSYGYSPAGISYAPPYGWWNPQPSPYNNLGTFHTGYLEEDLAGKPNERWPHTLGVVTGISFKYGVSIDATWRTAFEAAWMNWNQAPTKIYYYPASNGVVTFDKEEVIGSGANLGDTFCQGSGGITASCQAYGNTGTTGGFSGPALQWVAAHESGHGFSVGHIANLPDGRIINSILGYHNDFNNLYTYQPMDSEFINQFYP